VYFGINSTTVRYSPASYAIAVVRPFIDGLDLPDKLVHREGLDWCFDALDVFVVAGQPLRLGETVVRQYCPASNSWIASSHLKDQQRGTAVFDVYRFDDGVGDIRYSTDRGLVKCGSLSLDLGSSLTVHIRMTFWENDVEVWTIDDESGKTSSTRIDLWSSRSSNDKQLISTACS